MKKICMVICIIALILLVASCDYDAPTDSSAVSNESVEQSIPDSDTVKNDESVEQSIPDSDTSTDSDKGDDVTDDTQPSTADKLYSLTVLDKHFLLSSRLKSHYKEGEEIRVVFSVAICVGTVAEMNGGEEKPIGFETAEGHKQVVIYKMPAKDSVIRIYQTHYEDPNEGKMYIETKDKVKNGGEPYVIDKDALDGYYLYDENITVRTINSEFHHKGDFTLTLNGEEITDKKRVYDENGNFLCYEWSFVVPRDVTYGLLELDYSPVWLRNIMKYLSVPDLDMFQNNLLRSYYPVGHEITLKSTDQWENYDMVVKLDGKELPGREKITDENGKFLYYQWKLVIVDSDDWMLTLTAEASPIISEQ